MNAQTVLKRINRKLAHQDDAIRKARVFDPGIGEYYLVDLSLNAVIGTNLDLENLAAELGVA
jgi:hypothetical protein